VQHLTVIEGDLSRYESSDDGRFDKPIEADSDANVRETEDMTDAELVARLEAVRAQNDAKFAECIASNSELGSDIRAGIADMGAKIEGAKAEMTGEFSKAVAVLSSLAAETKVLSESARDRPTNFQMWKSNVAVAAAALALLLAILAFAGDRFGTYIFN